MKRDLNSIEKIAIIPARGGSKGIPRKNITDLCGRPLIAYSILAALNATLIDRVIVSTEDNEIASVSKEWGAEIPFLRPGKLAQDDSDLGQALDYTISHLGGRSINRAFVILYPTSPFRTPELIDSIVKLVGQGYDYISTVKRITMDPDCLYEAHMDTTEQLINISSSHEDKGARWRSYFRLYGSVHVTIGHKQIQNYYYELTDPCMLIDIDTIEDLQVSELVIENNMFDFKMIY